ncbi:adenosine deaminase [Vagococcus vulneris]|uniref:adenosine deaminase n=1 Tax=Vagococcus vulneris TaxID=1977869 RepID=A0A429ZZQ1_9ENTE|nr:adenosine deaminase [Vagococcus vulneris]RST99530.1 adenosine deaminase [Vagococcus vulneris]
MNINQIRELPKVELHCHLDGSVSRELLIQLAEKDSITSFDPDKISAGTSVESLKDYLDCFDMILPLLQSSENIKAAAKDVIRQAAEENVAYIEIRVAPLLHQQNGLKIDEVVKAVISGVAEAEKEYGCFANLLIIGMRHHEHAEHVRLAEYLSDNQNSTIVGFDFAGDEAAYSTEMISESIAFVTTATGLKLTLHAGECGCYQNVIDAVKSGAKRIGHGIAIKDSEEAMTICAEEGILLEMCPTSNIQTKAIQSINEFPLRLFLEKSVPFMISTDNRTVSNTTLSDEYLLLSEAFKLTSQEMGKINRDAIMYSFADEETKKVVLEKIASAYQE